MFNIEDFCADHHDIRGYLCRPFAWCGFLYASNGHIAVRIPADGFVDTEHSIGKSCARLFETNSFENLEPLPVYATVVLPPCGPCDGTGKRKALEECEECRGEGFVEWDNDFHTYGADCKGCDGEGEVNIGDTDITCERCKGSGTNLDVPVMFGATAISYRYLKLIQDLPGLLVGLAGNTFPDAIPFTFDGGVGIVMPIYPIKR